MAIEPSVLGDRIDEEEYYAIEENTQILKLTQENQEKSKSPAITPEELQQIKAAQQAIDSRRDANAERFPNSFAVQNTAAASALQAGDWDKGRAYADRALAIAQDKNDPRLQADALRVRAFGAFQARDFPQAAEDVRRVLELFPKDKDARVIYEFSKGRIKGSQAGPRIAADAAPSLPIASAYDDPRVKAMGRRAADRAAAIKKLEEAMRLLGSGGPAMAQAALQAADAAQRLDPSFADAAMQKALALQALKELTRALDETTKAIALWTLHNRPRNLPAAYSLRAKLENDARAHAAAAADAERALAYAPAFAPAYLQRARAREALDRGLRRALEDYRRAAELEPNYKADYDAAVARLSAGPRRGAPARDGKKAPLIVGAIGLLAGVGAAAWRRRREPAVARQALGGQYEIVSLLGEGGMGAVFKGWDKALKRPVAVKRLRAELQSNRRERERFLKEAELVASLHHPHIVDIYNIIRSADDTHLVFEYVEGATVADFLRETPGRRLPRQRALDILRQVAEAVDHAHSRHVIHRDLKPSNIMVADGGWVKVMDFGIARQVMDSLVTTTNTVVGTPFYMAPEQAMGAVVKQSDVFSLGVTLYELLTGALPFLGPDELHRKLEGVFAAPSSLVPDLGPAIDEVLRKALSPRAQDRYARCGELYQAAAKALGGRLTPPSRSAIMPRE